MLHKNAGIQLRELRINNGLTQEQLAEKLDVSGNMISAIETSSRKGSLDFYTKAASYFEVTLGNFFLQRI